VEDKKAKNERIQLVDQLQQDVKQKVKVQNGVKQND
jgi:hypothetical protein